MEYASFTGGEAAIKVHSDFEYVDGQSMCNEEELIGIIQAWWAIRRL
jgi:hypothetical protein